MTDQPTKCPKCGKYHGDDWSQCNGHCPMLMSPNFNGEARSMNAHVIPETNLDQIIDTLAELRAARSKGTDAMVQRAIEGRAASDRKQGKSERYGEAA